MTARVLSLATGVGTDSLPDQATPMQYLGSSTSAKAFLWASAPSLSCRSAALAR
jgi:hypothetical protein